MAASATAAPARQSSGGLEALYDVAVDTGSTTSFTDSRSVLWQADKVYDVSSGWGYSPTTVGKPDSNAHAVYGTVDDALYQTTRYWQNATGTYRFDVPTGTYSVSLRFADLWNTEPLRRQFDVQIQGIKYLSYMDIVSAAGPYTAYDWTFVVTVTASPLSITFIPQLDAAVAQPIVAAFVAGIRVSQLQSYSVPPRAAYARIGVGVNAAFGRITSYDVASMQLGWYTYWNIDERPSRPNGMEYVQLIGTAVLTPANLDLYDWPRLARVVAANPGSTWIVGNEIESYYQGNDSPDAYARILQRFYTYIKGLDATAQIAVGGVTVVTEARLQWIIRMAAAYERLFGAPIPADIWTIHDQIIWGSEGTDKHWPVGLPLDAAMPEFHGADCNLPGGPNDFADFKEHVRRMRAWMSAAGFRDKPLWISEYGVLGGDQYNCTQQVIGAYVAQTMQWLNTKTDPGIGMPSDDNRLVQRWLWYSMNDQPYNPTTLLGFSGALFDRASRQYPGALTGVGRAYLQWVSSITPPGPTPTPTMTPAPTATRTPLPPGNGVLQGQVQLQGRGVAPTPAWSVPVAVRLFLPGDPLPVYEYETSTDESGAFTVPGTGTPGVWASSYDVKVKNPQMLQASAANLALTDTAPAAYDFGVLKGGDATGDNRVSLPDVSVLASTYGKTSVEARYDARADFTGDARIGLPDLSVLASNYNQVGLSSLGRAAQARGVAAQTVPVEAFVVVPASISAAPGDLFNVDFSIDVIAGAGNAVSGTVDTLDFALVYDTTYLAASAVSCAGTLFTDFQSCSASGGTVGFTGSIFSPRPPAGTGNHFLIKVSFRALAPVAGTALTFTSGQACLAGACSSAGFSNGIVVIADPPAPTHTPTPCSGCPTSTPTATAIAPLDEVSRLWLPVILCE